MKSILISSCTSTNYFTNNNPISGHIGHIELPLPVCNPLFYGTILQLLKLSCIHCHRFRVPELNKELFLVRQRLLKEGLIIEAQQVQFFTQNMEVSLTQIWCNQGIKITTIFIFGAQASDVFGDPDEIDASINISEQRKKKLKSEVGNETDDLHRLRRDCDERLESNKRSVGIPLKSGLPS